MSVRVIICFFVAALLAAVPVFLAQAQTAPAATAAAAGGDGVIGTIQEVEGSGTVTPDGGAAVAAAINGPVHLNDVIAAGPQSRIFVLLIDNTQFTLSENSRMTVDQWVYDPDNTKDNKGRYSVLGGTFEYVSGLLAKKPNPDVQIATPSGSIGIRGTDLTGGEENGQYGIHVDDGAVDVMTDKGQVRVNQGEGTTLRGRGFAPGKPAKWSAARLSAFHQRVFLKNSAVVRQRVAAMQQRHQVMRQQYKSYMQSHPAAMQRQQDRRGQLQQNQQQRQNLRQDRVQQGKAGQMPNQNRPALQQARGQQGAAPQQAAQPGDKMKAWRERWQKSTGQAASGQAASGQAAPQGNSAPGAKLQQFMQNKAAGQAQGGGTLKDQMQQRQEERRKRLQELRDKKDDTDTSGQSQ